MLIRVFFILKFLNIGLHDTSHLFSLWLCFIIEFRRYVILFAIHHHIYVANTFYRRTQRKNFWLSIIECANDMSDFLWS